MLALPGSDHEELCRRYARAVVFPLSACCRGRPLLRVQPGIAAADGSAQSGRYRLDPGEGPDRRGNLAGFFGNDLQVRVGEQGLVLDGAGDDSLTLLPLDPGRYVTLVGMETLWCSFLRDGHGRERALLIERGLSRLYYRRVAPPAE